jgi:hypothetical protein
MLRLGLANASIAPLLVVANTKNVDEVIAMSHQNDSVLETFNTVL